MNPTQELFTALESGLSCTKIQRLIDNGADLCYKDPSSGEYSMTLALRKKLPLDYIKILYHKLLPFQHIFCINSTYRPSVKIVEYIVLRTMLEYPNVEFNVHFHGFSPLNQRMIEQAQGRGLRSTSQNVI